MGRDGHENRVIVAIHTWTGEDVSFRRLADHLDDVTIVDSPPPDPASGPLPRRVDAWVDHHLEQIRAMKVEPPYRFLGWSFGGVVAIELARRLLDADTVTYVGLVDTIRPRLLPRSDAEFIWYHLGAAAAMRDPVERWRYLRHKAAFLAVRRFPRLGGGVRAALIRLGYRRDRPVQRSEKPTDPLQVAIHAAYLNYAGEPVPFFVSLYATDESLRRAREPVLRWASWLHGGFEITTVPGGHFDVFEPPHVASLAAAIDLSLRRRDAAGIEREAVPRPS